MLMGNRIVLRSLESRNDEQKANAERRKQRDEQRAKQGGEQAAAAPAGPPGGSRGPRSPEAAEHAKRFDQNLVTYRGDTAPFMSSWRMPLPFWNVGADMPCFEPPFSQIGVIDLNQNKLLWKHNLGSMKLSGPFRHQVGPAVHRRHARSGEAP